MTPPRSLCFFAGYMSAGKKVRAVCHCGHFTTPRVDRERAREALDVEHGFSHPECAICGRDAQEFSGSVGRDRALSELQVIPIPDPHEGEPAEFFACPDLAACRERATQVLRDQVAPSGTATPPGTRPQLRLIQGGRAS